jgi:polyisoprenoid-binding protein YceI
MSATQTTGGVELPAPGAWSIDPGHAEVGFVGRHFGLARTRGRFTGVEGTVHVAADPTASTVEVTIDMASVDSGFAPRDASLRANWFDVDDHPTARFRSTAVTLDGAGGTVIGDLTIRGVTRPLVLDVEYLGFARDPWGNDRAAFSATATINREDGGSPPTWRSTPVACWCPGASSWRSSSS